MSRNPFLYDRDGGHDESSEFGFGRGRFPNPAIDYSDGGVKSRIPIADPDRETQLMELYAVRRMDVNDPNDTPSPFVAGNTDRYGAQPPLVREIKPPPTPPKTPYTRPRMQREY
jgi:hypothetical protein